MVTELKIKQIFVAAALFLPLIILGGCSKEPAPDQSGDNMAQLSINQATIMTMNPSDSDLGTKYILNDFITNYSYPMGFFITKSNDYSVPHTSGYLNLETVYGRVSNVWTWSFHLSDDVTTTRIPLYLNKGEVKIMSYYPYDESTTDIRRAPFHVEEFTTYGTTKYSAAWDYLWMTPLTVNPTAAGEIRVLATYNHVMSALLFNIAMQDEMSLNYRKIVIETFDGGNWLPRDGYFDATNGNVTTTTYTNRLEGYFDKNNTLRNTNGFLLPAIPVTQTQTNRKIKVSFGFGVNHNDVEMLFSEPVVINLADMKPNTSPARYGLHTGFIQYVYVEVNNFLKIENIEMPPAQPWDSEDVNIVI